MEKQGADAGEEQGGLNVQGQAVALDQNGHQDSGAEHGEHVLNAQQQHLGGAQRPRVADGFVVFFHRVSPFSICAKKETINI